MEAQRGLCKTQAKKLTPSEALVTFLYVSYEKFSVNLLTSPRERAHINIQA